MIKLLKSGSWALEGVNVVDMVEGTEGNFGSSENCKLVDAGWAEWVKAEPKAKVDAPSETRKPRAK
jgi:hypothetical protein